MYMLNFLFFTIFLSHVQCMWKTYILSMGHTSRKEMNRPVWCTFTMYVLHIQCTWKSIHCSCETYIVLAGRIWRTLRNVDHAGSSMMFSKYVPQVQLTSQKFIVRPQVHWTSHMYNVRFTSIMNVPQVQCTVLYIRPTSTINVVQHNPKFHFFHQNQEVHFVRQQRNKFIEIDWKLSEHKCRTCIIFGMCIKEYVRIKWNQTALSVTQGVKVTTTT